MTAKTDRYNNWDATIEDGKLTITINIDESQVNVQPSKSGKTLVVATTGGFARVSGSSLSLSLTLCRKP